MYHEQIDNESTAPENSFMSGDHSKTDDKSESQKPRRKAEASPPSDSRLTAVQREARENYQPASGTGTPRSRSESMESAEHAAVRHSTEAASISSLLTEASIGIHHLNQSRAEIQRSFTGGGNRYVLGAEFAIVAIVAIAGIARRRADLSDAQLKAFVGGEKSSGDPMMVGEIIYQSPKLKDKLKHVIGNGNDKQKKRRGSDKEMKLQHGFNKDVPEWLISLDNSVAKEAGYLFSSVLRRPTVLMTMSDTFVSLGEQHFVDAMLGWLIVDLNSRKITETWKGNTKVVAVNNGETIELPVWEDIVEFYQHKPKGAKPDNLLTVVLNRNLDRELIEATLASVVVPGSVNIVSNAPFDRDGVTDYRVTISGTEVRIHRVFFENLNSWHKMEKHLRAGRFSRRL